MLLKAMSIIALAASLLAAPIVSYQLATTRAHEVESVPVAPAQVTPPQVAQIPPVTDCACQQQTVTLLGIPGAPLTMRNYSGDVGTPSPNGGCVWSAYPDLQFRYSYGAWVLYRGGLPAYSSAANWNACQNQGTIVLSALPNAFPGVASVTIRGN